MKLTDLLNITVSSFFEHVHTVIIQYGHVSFREIFYL